MENVILVIHLILALCLIGIVLCSDPKVAALAWAVAATS